MARKEKMTSASQDGVQYRRAKPWQLALSQCSNALGMCFYMLMSYATYIGNANYGILVAVTGFVITASRLFDGVTDPIVAYIVERFDSKFGKIRIFTMLGWLTMSIATTAMCNLGAGHLDGIAGLIFFIVCYFVYILGYTFLGVVGNAIGNVLTNDPRQRPVVSMWNTIFGYVIPLLISVISMVAILPKYDSVIGTEFLAEYNLFVVALAAVFGILCCIAVSPYDKPENFSGVQTNNEPAAKPTFKDMWLLIKENKELQRYMISACSDKLAQTIGSASVVSTLLYGVMIGNLSMSSVISTVAMLPSIIFAIIAAKLAGKTGNKKLMVNGTWVCLGIGVALSLFLLFADTTQITVAIIPTVIYIVLTLGRSASNMVVSTATSCLRMDIVDYEMYRTGRYMPATVAATYTFVDKIISAFGASIPTLMIGLIGYTATTPQQGDPLTFGVRIMTVLIYCGFPIIGWICTELAMKNSELTREKMVEVQRVNQESRAAAGAMNTQ